MRFDPLKPMYLENNWLSLSDAGSSGFKDNRVKTVIIRDLAKGNSFAYSALFSYK